jgi:DNA-binding beta-propeller fold protein YncE
MKYILRPILSGIILASLICCNSEEASPGGEYANGIFIVNEGNFTESNGSIGFYSDVTEIRETDLFEKVNSVKTGGIIQSIYFYEDKAFIIDQYGSRIEVVDSESFESIATIDHGLNTPRYMVVANGKGYVTNWGNFDDNYDLPDSYIAIIDLENYTVTKSLDAGNGAEGLIVFGGDVFVANSYSNTIEVINTLTDEISIALTVPPNPVCFQEDMNSNVWVLSSPYSSGSALSKLDLTIKTIVTSFSVAPSARSLVINGAGDKLYYLSAPFGTEAEVRSLSIESTKDTGEALITAPNLYGLGIDPESNLLYIGNHNAFQGNGTVLRYNESLLIDSFESGVAPNGFVFRK